MEKMEKTEKPAPRLRGPSIELTRTGAIHSALRGPMVVAEVQNLLYVAASNSLSVRLQEARARLVRLTVEETLEEAERREEGQGWMPSVLYWRTRTLP